VLAGAAKEMVWDMMLRKGCPDFGDWFATVWGGLAGAVVWLMIVSII
jgi:hypothetical protein